MKNSIIVSLMVAAAFIGGCSKDDGGTNPPPAVIEDWTFPADTTEAAGYMYCAQETVAVSASFDVKVILYNVDSAWAAALEFSYTGAQIEVTDALAGPFIGPDADILTVKELEADSSRASMGVTFKRGTHPAGVSGSGVVMKLKCRGKAAGSGMISINTTKLHILKADGSSAIGLLLNGDLGIIVR